MVNRNDLPEASAEWVPSGRVLEQMREISMGFATIFGLGGA